MSSAVSDLDTLAHEHQVLLREHGRVQARCTALLQARTAENERLHAEVIRLRAAVVLRDTALAWAREDRTALEAAMPGVPRRVSLARHVDALQARLRELMREHLHRHAPIGTAAPAPDPASADALESSLQAADLVICQTGCVSHGAYWRVQDHCRRTGKTCVLVDQPQALRIVRIDLPTLHHAR